MRPLLAACVCTLLALPVAAQEGGIDLRAASSELHRIFQRPTGQRVNAGEVIAKLDAFLEKYQAKDLGSLSYVPALRAYFARDYVGATEALDGFFKRHRKIADPEQRNMAGRIYVSALARELRGGETEKILHYAEWALNLYDDKKLVTRFIAAGIPRLEHPEKVRVAVSRQLLHSNLKDAEIDSILKDLYDSSVTMGSAGPRRRARRIGGKPAAGQLAARRFPTDIKPFHEKAMSGKVIDLSNYAGKVVLVDFWATWCGPCIREMPHVVRAYEKYKGKGFEIIGVSLDRQGAEKKIETTTAKLGMTWEQIYDGGGWGAKLAKQNGIHSIPFTFLIDRKGKVRATRLRGAALERQVEKLLGER